jgi:hypothetical protein
MENANLHSRAVSFQKTGYLYILIVLALALYSTVRIISLSQSIQRVKSTADTTAYMRISQEPVLSGDFLAGSRPMLFPMVLKMFGQQAEKVAWAQGVFSILSWSLLAVAVASSLRTNILRFAAVCLILLLGLYQYIIGWDSVLLTESLSLSLMALLVSGWLWLMHGWRWGKVVLILVAAFLWSLSRDTNAWVLLMIAGVLLMLLIFGIINKKYLVFIAAFGILFYFSNLSADLGNRWVFPFQNVLGRRLLPNTQAVDHFASCGMPVSPNLMRLAGEFANGQDRAFYNDPALESYRSWLHASGKSCYIRWLLSDPLQSFGQPMSEFDVLVGMQKIQPFLFSGGFSPVLPARVEAALTLRQQSTLVFILASSLAILALLTRAMMRNKAWWVAIVLAALVFPHFFIVWHGDVLGIERHAVSAGIQLYLGMWILLLLASDELLGSITSRKSLMTLIPKRNVKS